MFTRFAQDRLRWWRLATRAAATVAATAALAAAVAAPAHGAAVESSATAAAGAPVAGPPCELDIDTYKLNNTIYSYAVQLCEDKPPNQLYFDLETQVCDSWSCSWVAWKHVHGSIAMACPTSVSVWRSSRLRSKTVWCWGT